MFEKKRTKISFTVKIVRKNRLAKIVQLKEFNTFFFLWINTFLRHLLKTKSLFYDIIMDKSVSSLWF